MKASATNESEHSTTSSNSAPTTTTPSTSVASPITKSGVPNDMPSIKIKRKHIHLRGADKYGHWWTELGGDSYGWWPKYGVGLKETLLGTEGELNGQTSFGGTPTTDPHHGDTPEEDLRVECTDPTKTEAAVLGEIRTFARSYSGEWRWTFGFGQNCHTFQKSLLANSKLKIK